MNEGAAAEVLCLFAQTLDMERVRLSAQLPVYSRVSLTLRGNDPQRKECRVFVFQIIEME